MASKELRQKSKTAGVENVPFELPREGQKPNKAFCQKISEQFFTWCLIFTEFRYLLMMLVNMFSWI